MLSREEIINIIKQRFPGEYNEDKINSVLDEIQFLDPEVREALENYLRTGEIKDLEAEGCKVTALMDKKGSGLNPIAAYLTLDYLKASPEEAKKNLKWVNGLPIFVHK